MVEFFLNLICKLEIDLDNIVHKVIGLVLSLSWA